MFKVFKLAFILGIASLTFSNVSFACKGKDCQDKKHSKSKTTREVDVKKKDNGVKMETHKETTSK